MIGHLFNGVYGQLRSGLRGNAIKGANVFDVAARLGAHRMRAEQASIDHIRADPEMGPMLEERWLAPFNAAS